MIKIECPRETIKIWWSRAMHANANSFNFKVITSLPMRGFRMRN